LACDTPTRAQAAPRGGYSRAILAIRQATQCLGTCTLVSAATRRRSEATAALCCCRNRINVVNDGDSRLGELHRVNMYDVTDQLELLPAARKLYIRQGTISMQVCTVAVYRQSGTFT